MDDAASRVSSNRRGGFSSWPKPPKGVAWRG
jgi:hypothetical protein